MPRVSSVITVDSMLSHSKLKGLAMWAGLLDLLETVTVAQKACDPKWSRLAGSRTEGRDHQG